jgi:hypothetical protein
LTEKDCRQHVNVLSHHKFFSLLGGKQQSGNNQEDRERRTNLSLNFSVDDKVMEEMG